MNRKLQVQVGHLQVEKDIHSHGFGWSVRFNQNRGCRSRSGCVNRIQKRLEQFLGCCVIQFLTRQTIYAIRSGQDILIAEQLN